MGKQGDVIRKIVGYSRDTYSGTFRQGEPVFLLECGHTAKILSADKCRVPKSKVCLICTTSSERR